jgi:hypothetical protein
MIKNCFKLSQTIFNIACKSQTVKINNFKQYNFMTRTIFSFTSTSNPSQVAILE